MKIIIITLLAALFVLPVQAEKTYKYRISLTDKVGSEYTLDKPQDFLSVKALERRSRQQLGIDSTDLPVSRIYLKELAVMGAQIVTTSKWNNTVVIEITDTLLIKSLKSYSFVKDVRKVWTQGDNQSSKKGNCPLRQRISANKYPRG